MHWWRIGVENTAVYSSFRIEWIRRENRKEITGKLPDAAWICATSVLFCFCGGEISARELFCGNLCAVFVLSTF